MNYDPNGARSNDREQGSQQNAQSGAYGQGFDANGQGPNQGWQYGNPYNPNGFSPNNGYYPPNQPDSAAKNAQIFGIVSLIGLFFCQILSIVFGALAVSNAKKSVLALGYECSEAKTGRICGLIGLILGIVSVAFTVFGVIFYVFFFSFLFAV